MTAPAVVVAPEAEPVGAPQPPRIKTILKHLALSLLTAMVIPAVLFYLTLVLLGIWAALIAALAWCYGATAWRWATKRRTSGLLILSVAVMTLRTAVALSSGDTFLYFLQPVASDALIASTFLVSLTTARPIVARLAADFYPMHADIAKRPRVQRLFWQLTLLWAVVYMCKGTITFWLLQSQSLETFVLVKSFVLLTLTLLAVTVTVLAATRVARTEGLLPKNFATA